MAQTPVACNALTRRGHPCRGYADHETGLCHMHTGFFEPVRFFAYVTGQCDFMQSFDKREWILRAMRSRSFQPSAYYQEQILVGATQNTDTWRRGSATYLYEVFVKAGVIPPYTLPTLWQRYITNRLDILRYTAPHNRTERMMTILTDQLFKPFFRDTPINTTLLFVFRYLALSDRRYGTFVTDDMWSFLISTILTSIPPEQLICLNREAFFERLDKFSQDPRSRSNVWSGHLRERLTGILNASYEVSKNIVKLRADPQKEEIMAAAWHPSRFLEWCVDTEELASLRGSWDLNRL